MSRNPAFPNVNHFKDGPVEWPAKVMVGPYLEKVLNELWLLMGDDFLRFNFLIYRWATWADCELRLPFPDKTVLIILADNSGHYPEELARHVHAIFKVHMPAEKSNIFPLPLGYTKFHLHGSDRPLGERKTSVFFSGNINKNRIQLWAAVRLGSHLATLVKPLPIRRALTFAARKLPGALRFSQPLPDAEIKFSEKFATGLSPEEYTRKLNDSKIALCPKGFYKTECFRHFEAMRSGCVIVSDPIPDVWYFKDSPIIQVTTWHNINQRLKYLLSDTERLQNIQKKTISWWRDHCGEKATAEYMAKKILEILSP
jgi:glycosyltransferase involved in cell wall biosynthesis